MKFEPLSIPDVKLIHHTLHRDERGELMELFRQSEFVRYCGDFSFVQENLSRSKQGTLRGLHYQGEQSQGKLVQSLSGTIFDVAVDLRRESPTYGQWVGQLLSAEEAISLWIPPGFAHGFYVLTEWAHVLYKCTDYYNPEDERTLNWAEPALAIVWPLIADMPLILSDRDRQAPLGLP
ncbi:dTDP-4-dehydrorhamnose 3,5-epimerase [Aeromonas caviae]|uniref:dTDP-4-dehydrorhamnose 3,5-epimerase n=1 Tax=Aeromonas TaxID=642 RepID=UPI0022E4941C|nr:MULTISPECIES: dTDP-4-dehydrorhamnose 3,5-epimerase [Aeromonas]MEB5775839.1 dTDP-4-dehydrorhamnose 3,5-epimerase [Aeromonas caviae]MEB6651065.1 dTDP-4-dehydrorhamnose 3,5-epimerase [Aeromonas caviae]